jgi:nitrogen fixation NifU-like protein
MKMQDEEEPLQSRLDELIREIEEKIKEDEKELYGEKIIEEAYNPKNVGVLDNPDGAAIVTDEEGETMEVHLRVEETVIKDSTFQIEGHGATVACGSVITEIVKGKTVDEAFEIATTDIEAVLGTLPEENAHSPVLAVNALRAALEDYKERH